MEALEKSGMNVSRVKTGYTFLNGIPAANVNMQLSSCCIATEIYIHK